jgi:hypothetical protein
LFSGAAVREVLHLQRNRAGDSRQPGSHCGVELLMVLLTKHQQHVVRVADGGHGLLAAVPRVGVGLERVAGLICLAATGEQQSHQTSEGAHGIRHGDVSGQPASSK